MLQFSDRTSEELPLPLAWKLCRKQLQMPSGHSTEKHQVKCLEPTMIYVLNGDVVHQTLELQLGGKGFPHRVPGPNRKGLDLT